MTINVHDYLAMCQRAAKCAYVYVAKCVAKCKHRGITGPRIIMALVATGFFLSVAVASQMGTASIGLLKVTSQSFAHGGSIPDKFTDTEHGNNVSPPISWTRGPWGTRAYALVCIDPDALTKGRVHWVVYNIPKDVTELSEGAGKMGSLEVIGVPGARHGYNSWRRLGWKGPQEDAPGVKCHYKFKLYALNLPLMFKDKNVELEAFMRELKAAKKDGRVVAKGKLLGTYYYSRPTWRRFW